MTVARKSGSSLICPRILSAPIFMQTGLSLKNLPFISLTHHTFMGPRQHKQAADASASHLILKLGSPCRPQPMPACLPNGFRKIGLGKPFFRKTGTCQSPSTFLRAGSCLNCPSLHVDLGEPRRCSKARFGDALCPVSPQIPSCCRCSSPGIRSDLPGRGGHTNIPGVSLVSGH